MGVMHHCRTIFSHQHTCGEPGCLRVYATIFELKQHARQAHHKPYRCECGHLDSRIDVLGYHITHANRAASKSIVHTQATLTEPHTCAEEGCHRVYSNGSKLQEHAKVTGHKAYRCVCSKSYSKLCSLGRHIDETRDDGEGKYKCPECPKGMQGFKRLNHLEQHLRSRHKQTAKEVKAILFPFRKRKTTASKSALTAGSAAKQNDAQNGPSPTEQSSSFVGSTAEARTAFLAVTTGAIPPAQDANTTTSTEGPAGDLAHLSARPVDFNLGATMEDLKLDGDNPSLQAPQWSDQLEFQADQGAGIDVFSLNGLSTSHSVHDGNSGASITADLNSYMPSSQYGLTTPSMNSLAPWASPFGGSQFDGSMMQYNSWSMTPNFGTFINQNGPLTGYYSPVNPVLGQSTSLNYGQMDCLPFNSVGPDFTAGQIPMGNMLGYHSMLPVNLGDPTFATGCLDDTEACTQSLTVFMGYNGLSEDSNAADLESQVFPGQAD